MAGWQALAAVALLATTAATPGTPDPSWGGDGVVVTDVGLHEVANDVVVAPDGGVVVAGFEWHLGAFLVGYRADGSLDPAFGGGDALVAPRIGNAWSTYRELEGLGDGSLVAAGSVDLDTGVEGDELFVAGHRRDGSFDPAFGGGDGWTAVHDDAYRQVSGMAVQDDGRIVVVASSTESGDRVLRFTAAGEPDPTFGDGGSVAVPGWVDDVAVLAAGRLALAGTWADGTDRATVVVLLPDGSPDASFGEGGVVAVDPYGLRARFYAVAARGTGLVATGAAAVNDVGDDVVVAAFGPDGRLDPTFGGDGVAAEPLGSGYDDRGVDVEVQADGRVLVAAWDDGWQLPQATVLRFRPSGRLDRSFGGTGVVHTDAGESNSWSRMALTGGAVVLAGVGRVYGQNDYLVVGRLLR